MHVEPACGSYLLRWRGDALVVTLRLDALRPGRAVLRTNFGQAAVRRAEIIAAGETGAVPLARAWHDLPMAETAPGVFSCTVPLDEVGVFSAKPCFFPAGVHVPEWPDGANFHVKVQPAHTRRANAIYTVFTRQFGGAKTANPESRPGVAEAERFLDAQGFAVVPPSGTFRDVVRSLDHVFRDMGFGIVQLLPIFPVPTTFARMGRYGCPFAALDFLSVDPALAEFDPAATPLDQFRELVRAVHARGGDLYLDLPANHTGWAATLQTHHPDWYRHAADGRFVSPGAWGVTWADLVELDYAHPELRRYMADVFLFWCRLGVDGFRCDAGYMIPEDTWEYIVARVRDEYPDVVFLLEGLGGKISVTDALLSRAGLDWAYSEIFQTPDRDAFARYLPGAIARAETYGPLVHFAETHDNDRLAKGGKTYARLRVALAALFSHQGAWGLTNGVEWFADEKVDVHGASSLAWGAPDNLVGFIARLNALLRGRAAFGPGVHLELVTRGGGNVLALVRKCPDPRDDLLVLANLDCNAPAVVHWDAARCPSRPVAWDFLSETRRPADADAGVALAPGEVLCLGDGALRPLPPSAPKRVEGFAVEWRWPQDARREAVVPDGAGLLVSAPHPFRVEVRAGARTVAAARAETFAQTPFGALLQLPPYGGDGTATDTLELALEVYAPDGVKTNAVRVHVAPPPEKAALAACVPGAAVRADPALKTVLSNGAGACAQVPLAWGTLRSQYDALFAANPNPAVPADRLVLWTRCRAWLLHEGYSREVNAACLTAFTADPAGRAAVWHFRVPCGMGRVAAFSFRLALAENANAVRFSVCRHAAGADELGAPVRLVLRPDLEWRCAHAVTKAQGETENVFARALRPRPDGFSFAPWPDAGELVFSVSGGEFHAEPEWTYMLAHPEEQERGQEPCGDLYSPGWIACHLAPDGAAEVRAACANHAQQQRESGGTPLPQTCPAPCAFYDALSAALRLFIVRRDDVKTVIAGYPWFLDWGRDTFIFLRGAIAAGFVKEAQDVVLAFARWEENGTLPNVIYGDHAGNRDTTDAQLWFILAVRDLVAKIGRGFLKTDCGGRTLAAVLDSIAAHYVSGTPNGIRVDPESALVWSPAHFTWMDTNYPACTPRCGYPVEIQALWIAALRFLGGTWKRTAEKAAAALVRLFARPDGQGLYDCLDAANGESAASARPDAAVRPNQIFVLSLDALPAQMDAAARDALARQILAAVGHLVTPHGLRSLDPGDARYRGVYTGDEDTSRKPAYHNGTVWAWPLASYAEALAQYGVATPRQALGFLSALVDNAAAGVVGHLSEIADGDAPHAQKGCRAQAWSASETLRVWSALSAPRGACAS